MLQQSHVLLRALTKTCPFCPNLCTASLRVAPPISSAASLQALLPTPTFLRVMKHRDHRFWGAALNPLTPCLHPHGSAGTVLFCTISLWGGGCQHPPSRSGNTVGLCSRDRFMAEVGAEVPARIFITARVCFMARAQQTAPHPPPTPPQYSHRRPLPSLLLHFL